MGSWRISLGSGSTMDRALRAASSSIHAICASSGATPSALRSYRLTQQLPAPPPSTPVQPPGPTPINPTMPAAAPHASATTHSTIVAPCMPGPTSASRIQSPNSISPAVPPRHFKHPIQAPTDYMHTRSKSGIIVPKKHFNLSALVHISSIPTNYRTALKDPNWLNAMREEFNALMNQNTWTLVPRPAGVNVVAGKWIYRHKYNSDGSLARYKARWVVRGFTQQHGVDYEETFSPVIKPATIRVVLSLAASRDWPIQQLDVKNAFLHGDLLEKVYAQQPAGFVSPSHPDYVCLLNKSLYGLK
jgi:hypothetical protein